MPRNKKRQQKKDQKKQVQEKEEVSTIDYSEINNSPYKISLENFNLNVAGKYLIKNSTLNLSEHQRYGLIGRNGAGKSTLLKTIASKKQPIHPDTDILYLEQEIDPSPETVFNVVMDSNTKKKEWEKRLAHIEHIIDEDPDSLSEEDWEEYQDIQDELNVMGAEKDQAKVRKILNGLGFTTKMQDSPTEHLSGGWRMRVSLAKALYLEPRFLFLDEPTNHLDLEAVIWLTDYLSGWKHALLVVSHDRHFLNQVVNRIVHINTNKVEGQLEFYQTDYDGFIQLKEQEYQKNLEKWTRLMNTIKVLRGRCGVPKGKLTSLQCEADEIKPEKPYNVNIKFPEVRKETQQIVGISDVSFGYDPNDLILEKVDFGVDMDTRITIVGANGSGKSTLINLLVGNLNPLDGHVSRHSKLRIGYYNQHFVGSLPNDKTPIEYLQNTALEYGLEDYKEIQSVRRLLGMIGLKGDLHGKLIKTLSGGQKSRLAICALYVQSPHLLLLDEPTNHLDIETIQALIEGINAFQGGVIMISHNADLITETNSQIWLCDKKKIQPFEGDYEDYAEYVLENN